MFGRAHVQVLQAELVAGKSCCCFVSSAAPGAGQIAQSAIQEALQQQGNGSLEDVVSEAELAFAQLGLTDKLLGNWQYGQTLLVRLISSQECHVKDSCFFPAAGRHALPGL